MAIRHEPAPRRSLEGTFILSKPRGLVKQACSTSEGLLNSPSHGATGNCPRTVATARLELIPSLAPQACLSHRVLQPGGGESRAAGGRVDLVDIVCPDSRGGVSQGIDCGDDSHEDEGQEHGVFDRGSRLVVPVESQQIVEHWRTLEENPGSSLVAVVRAGYELGFESTR